MEQKMKTNTVLRVYGFISIAPKIPGKERKMMG
jgi:hypothetical protein